MGLLGNLFNKKVCSICGGDIGLLGNRKLQDGNLCKHCAAKLSPWFSERRHSTVNQIAAQLQDREENLRRIPSFQATRTYGGTTKLIIDDRMNAFMVTSSSRWLQDNPDIIDYACVTDCQVDIREHRTEIYRKKEDGTKESFQPPRYEYDYDCHVTIRLNHPWIDDVHFMLRHDIPADNERSLSELIRVAEDVAETMSGVRPDFSTRVRYRPPFCHVCGSELPEKEAPCLFCQKQKAEAKLQDAITPMPAAMLHDNAPAAAVPVRPMPPVGAPVPGPGIGEDAPLREHVAPRAERLNVTHAAPVLKTDRADDAPLRNEPLHSAPILKADRAADAPLKNDIGAAPMMQRVADVPRAPELKPDALDDRPFAPHAAPAMPKMDAVPRVTPVRPGTTQRNLKADIPDDKPLRS